MMKSDREQLVEDLHTMARLIQAYPEIPLNYGSLKLNATISMYMYGWDDEDNENIKTTLAKIAKRIKRHVKVKKDYTTSGFSLSIKPREDSRVELRLSTNREAVCEKKVVGTKWVPPSKGYVQDIVEWECTPLLKEDK